MIEWSDTNPDLNVLEAEYKRLLGFPADYILDGRVRELADWARHWYREQGTPWIYSREVELVLAGGTVQINRTEFAAHRLYEQLNDAGAEKAMVVAVSAGSECEEKARELWRENKPDEYFFLEIFASAVVEHLVTRAGARICAWAEENAMAVLPHYSPGYSGWNTADQVRLFDAFRAGAGDLPGQLRVMDSGMLNPKKSLLAVFGVTRQIEKVRRFANLVPCENCSFSPCQFRRAPYLRALPQLEDVAQLQPRARNRIEEGTDNCSRLDQNARYSVNPRALRKWSEERLELRVLEDQSIQARFRYEGTTCSNLGRPIAYDYLIKFDDDNYRILEATCTPAPEDTGHRFMCEFINSGDQLSSKIAKESPLQGRPLKDVLAWERPFSPAGCYCDEESRMHKWGLVLEVIHYALANGRKPSNNLQRFNDLNVESGLTRKNQTVKAI